MKKKPPPKPTPAKRKLAREIERVMIPPTRESLLDSLRQITPGAFADGNFNLQQFADIIGIGETGGERYRFDWAGKREAVELLQSPSPFALIPRRQESAEFDSTRNIYIEGDNLEAMKLLCTAYAGRVKMIYIDPPYNTGKDFIYADNFRDSLGAYLEFSGQLDSDGKAKSAKAKEEEKKINGHMHSRWLSMMYPRLFVARELLRDDGVIFISIDDNEVHHLRLLMNMVFGEENFIGDIIWNSTKSRTNTALLSVSHTHNLAYFKQMSHFVENRNEFRLPETGKGFSNPDNDPRGPWKADPFQVGGWRPNQQYTIVNPQTGAEYRPNEGNSWKNDHKKFLSLLADKRIVFGASGEAGPQRKRFLSEAIRRGSVANTLWTDVQTTTQATRDMTAMFGKSVFDNPKPVALIKKILLLGAAGKDSVILDFFSGSATTAHAVMELNAEDGGIRRCISIQIPETCDAKSEAAKAGYKTIADIGKERIRRAAQKIRAQIDAAEKEESGQKKIEREESERKESAAPLDLGFRVFQLACSNFREWSGAAKGTLESWKVAQQAALDLLPDKFDEESVVAEIMLAEGWTLTCRMEKLKSGKNRVWRITDSDFADGEKTMHICLDDKIAPDLHRRLGLTEDSVLVVRDKALTDCLAANLALQCRLKTV